MIPIRLLGPKVLVALEPKATAIEASTGMNYHQQEVTASGIILAQPTDMYDADEHSRGIVMALGEKTGVVELERVVRAIDEAAIHNALPHVGASGQYRPIDFETLAQSLRRLQPAPFDVEVGDVVLFAPSAGVSLGEQEDGISYVILYEKDLIAVIQPKSEAA